MQTIAVIAGAIMLLLALAGFVRALLRPPPKPDRDDNSPSGLPPGYPPT